MADQVVDPAAVAPAATEPVVTPEKAAPATEPVKTAAVQQPIPADIKAKQEAEAKAQAEKEAKSKEDNKSKAAAKEKSLLDKAGDKSGTPPAEKVVPETYEFKAPEGVELDKAAVDAFTPLAKEAKLTQEEAQKFFDLHTQRIQEFVKTQKDAGEAVIKAWRDESVKELGAKMNEQLAFVAKAKQFFSKEAQDLFNEFGLGDNIHFLRGMMKIGQQISEDKLVDGTLKTEEGGSAEKMYPSMAKQK